MSNTVLITGGNKGIGFEMARQLGAKGWKVIIAGRDEERLAKALQKLKEEGADAGMLVMDVSDQQSITDAATAFSKLGIKLNVIINNAGILLKEDSGLLYDQPAIVDKIVHTNSYGPLYVTRAFLPYMSTPARIINISSGGGSMTDEVGGWSPAYCVSKSFLNAITRHLSYELRERNISVNAVCPGWVQTEMGGDGAPRPVSKGAETPVWLATEASQGLTGKFFRDKKEIPW